MNDSWRAVLVVMMVLVLGFACGDDDAPRDAGSGADRAAPVDMSSAPDGSEHVICALPGGGECHQNDTCQTGMCPDGTPVTCVCMLDGTLGRCTGACPPGDAAMPVLDAAVDVDAGHGH